MRSLSISPLKISNLAFFVGKLLISWYIKMAKVKQKVRSVERHDRAGSICSSSRSIVGIGQL